LYDAVRGPEHPFVHHTSLVGASAVLCGPHVAAVTYVSIERAGEATASWHYLILPASRGSGKVAFVFAILSTR
jgi:hypothetical protein